MVLMKMNKLSHRIAAFAALVAIVILVIYSAIAFYVSRDHIVSSAERSLVNDAAHANFRIESRIKTVGGTLGALSKNAIFFNALVDSAGRETYLAPFLQGFSTIDGIPISMGLLDFQGDVILQNRPLPNSSAARAWLAERIADAQSGATVLGVDGDQKIVFAQILAYPRTRTVEGVLYGAFDLALLNPLVPDVALQGDVSQLLVISDKSIPANNPLKVKWAGAEKTVWAPVKVPPELAGLHLATEIRRSSDEIQAAMQEQVLLYVIGGFVVVLIVVGVSFWFAGVLVRPLRELEMLAGAVIENGTFNVRLEAKGAEEIDCLRVTFNALLDYLDKAYRDLKFTASELQAIVRSIPDRLIVLGEDGAALPFSSGEDTLREAGERKGGMVLPLPPRYMILERMKKLNSGGNVEIMEYQEIPEGSPDQKPKFYEARLTRIPKNEGRPALKLMLVRDTSKAREVEERLRQAQKMEAVGQLTGGIAHDFNNLLAVTIGNIELAQDEAAMGGTVLPYLANVKRASERGAGLVKKLLAFSRRQTLFPQAMDAGKMVVGMSDLLFRSIGETISISTTADDNLWPCEVDPHQFESAILNLCINARDAMPRGGELGIHSSNVSLAKDHFENYGEVVPGDYISILVADTGSGMSPDVIEQAFEPFFTTKEVGQGTGLGLSMVYGFVHQSGGYVTIDSEPGKGTRVNLFLPRCDAGGTVLADPVEEAAVVGGHETILVVEDDSDVRSLAIKMLRGFGYKIIEAKDGPDALEAIKKNSDIDMLFSDVVLSGGMSGPEVARKIRKSHPDIAVLLTSCYPDLESNETLSLDEWSHLLPKPYLKADLLQKIRFVLDQDAQ